MTPSPDAPPTSFAPEPDRPAPDAGAPMRVAAVGDLHVGDNLAHPYRDLFSAASRDADVLCLCGDLTNFGKTREAEILAEDLQACTIPVIGVLGNHDYECGQPEEVERILTEAGVKLLNGEAYEIDGVGFAGGKGFIGGFGRHMLSSFGEPAIKAFVQAAVDDANRIENSIRMLRTDRKVVLLHYSPIAETLEGEPPEIFPFLGSSRLGETIDRYENISLVLHGHAHRGSHQGRTTGGAPVYNVALPILRTLGERPYAVFEI